MKDLSKTREVQSDQSVSHSLVLHSIEGMVEAYLGLNESVREMVKFTESELRIQRKDDEIAEGRQQAKLERERLAAATNGKPLPSQPLSTSSNGSSASGASAHSNSNPPHPNIQVSIPDNSSLPDAKPVPNESVEPTTPTSADSGVRSESPYTPKVYQETPLPSPSKSSTSTSTSSTISPSPPIDPNSAEGKRLERAKKMKDLQQDYAALLSVKRHCVKTLRALRNAHMLVSAVDTLKDILADKEFQAAWIAFQAITEIFHTLVPYSKLPLLRCLNEHVECYKALLRKDIFAIFREYVGDKFMGGMAMSGSMSPSSGGGFIAPPVASSSTSGGGSRNIKMSQLTKLDYCCRLIDSLYSSFERKELVKWWITVSLAGYTQNVARKQYGDFMQPRVVHNQLTGFESLEKIFGWIMTELRDMYDAEYVHVFPKIWYVDALFVRKFFEVVRVQVAATLESQEQSIKEENNARKALMEAKKAQAIMAEMNHQSSAHSTLKKLAHSASASNLSLRASSTSASAAAAASSASNGGRVTSISDMYAPQPSASNHVSPPPPQQSSSSQSQSQSQSSHPSNSALGTSVSASTAGSNHKSSDSIDLNAIADEKPLVFDFYRPLLKTIEFENQIRSRWLNPSTQSSLSEEDLYGVLGTVPNPALNTDIPQPKNPPPYPFQFAGYISSAFHPYLPHMLKSERTRFYNFLEELDEEDTWDVESADITTCHFSAATKLFVMIQKSMERYSKVMPCDAFLDLFKEYRTSISNYLELLSKHLPASKNLQEEEVSSLCATINTSDYILDRSSLLARTFIQMVSGIDVETNSIEELNEEQQSFINILREQVDFSQVEEQVSSLNHRATHVLAGSILRKLEPSLQSMKEGRTAGGANASGTIAGMNPSMNGGSTVNDENRYIREIIYTLRQTLTPKAKMSSFAYLAQVVTQELLKLYHTSLRGVKYKITESVAQQMLLDLQSLKNFLLHGIPEMKVKATRAANGPLDAFKNSTNNSTSNDGSTSATAIEPALPAAFKPFIRLIHTASAPIENLLKSLTAPNGRLISTYKIIFPKADHKSVYDLLTMRGLTSGDQEKLIKSYNATQKNPSDQIPIMKKDFFGNIKDMVRDAKHVINS